jgi:hypothetical protein
MNARFGRSSPVQWPSGNSRYQRDTGPSGVAKKASNQQRRAKNRCPRRHSFDRFTVLLALLCNMNGNEKRRQVLDLTALTG